LFSAQPNDELDRRQLRLLDEGGLGERDANLRERNLQDGRRPGPRHAHPQHTADPHVQHAGAQRSQDAKPGKDVP
jgi:hypothetical protein